MGIKAKYRKETKVKTFKDYEVGKNIFSGIAKNIGTTAEVLIRWYLKCEEHGTNVFDTSNVNRTYSKDFKLSLINDNLK